MSARKARQPKARRTTDSTRRRARQFTESESAQFRRSLLLPYVQKTVDDGLREAFNAFVRLVADHHPGAYLGDVVAAYHDAIDIRLQQQRASWAAQHPHLVHK